MLLEDGGINKPDIDNLFNVQKYLRGISLYADGICVSKEMILEWIESKFYSNSSLNSN